VDFPFIGDIAQRQADQLGCGLVAWEMASLRMLFRTWGVDNCSHHSEKGENGTTCSQRRRQLCATVDISVRTSLAQSHAARFQGVSVVGLINRAQCRGQELKLFRG